MPPPNQSRRVIDDDSHKLTFYRTVPRCLAVHPLNHVQQTTANYRVRQSTMETPIATITASTSTTSSSSSKKTKNQSNSSSSTTTTTKVETSFYSFQGRVLEGDSTTQEDDGDDGGDDSDENNEYSFDDLESALLHEDGPLQGGALAKGNVANSVDLAKKMNLSVRVQNDITRSEKKGEKRVTNIGKDDRATSEQVLDPRTRLILFKLLNNGFLEEIDGCLSTGKEANVYYARGGQGQEYAVKIFKTSILVFKDRDRYVSGEYRFRNGYCKSNPRKMVKVWAEKEMRNLKRLVAAGIPCPTPWLLKSHVLVMDFLGNRPVPSINTSLCTNLPYLSTTLHI